MTFTLSALIWIPILFGVIILLLGTSRDLVRGMAITAAAITLFLAASVFWGYNQEVAKFADTAIIAAEHAGMERGDALSSVNDVDEFYEGVFAENPQLGESQYRGTALFAANLRLEEYVLWIPDLGIGYALGVDGLTAPMVLL